MPSAEKHTAGAKRGKICNKYQVLENTNVSFDWLIVQKLFNKHKMNSNSKHFFSRWLDMPSDKFLPHWNMLTWWLSPSNNSLGLLFRPYKTNVAVSKWGPQKKQSRRIIVLRLLSIQRQFSMKNASHWSGPSRSLLFYDIFWEMLRDRSLLKRHLAGVVGERDEWREPEWKFSRVQVLVRESQKHAWDLYYVCACVRVHALIPKAPLELGTGQKSRVHILGLRHLPY